MKSFRVEYTERVLRELKKMDAYTRRMLVSWIGKNLDGCEDPRAHGKALSSNRKGQWRYRVGDYRLICLIEDERLVILALSVGHRRDVYDK